MSLIMGFVLMRQGTPQPISNGRRTRFAARPIRLFVAAIFGILCIGRLCTAQDPSDTPLPKPSVNYLDLLQQRRAPLNPTDEEKAIAAAVRITGMEKEQFKSVGAIKLIDDEDKTPFLHELIVNRPIWWVTTESFSLELSSTPAGWHDSYPRLLDVFLDPESGHLLKLATRWPDGEKEIAPEPDAANAEWQMGAEKYLGTPDDDPPISFFEANDVIQRDGGNPLVAKQVTGVWVQWTSGSKEPRPMWVITLRGVPPMHRHGVSNPDLLNHLRYVVDPIKKRLIMAGTTPQPTQLKIERPVEQGK